MDEQGLQVGDWVRWSSQAGGVWREKVGQIVAVVPGRTAFWRFLASSGLDERQYHVRYDHGQRKHDSFLVVVAPEGKGKASLYWPRVAALEKVERS